MWQWFLSNGIWILVAIIIGLMVFIALKHWAGRLLRKVVPEALHGQMDDVLRIMTWVIIGIGGVLIILSVTAVIIAALGGNVDPILAAIGGWMLEHGVRIFIVIGIAYLVHRLARVLTPRLIERSITGSRRGRRAKAELKKRAETLSHILTQVIAIVIVLIALFMVLTELGINVTAGIAGLGIIGISVGFGAQWLIRDLIAGFFVFLENQYNVGDVIQVGETWGIVEDMSLRRTIARDLDGARHVIPNGEIRILSNYTQDISRVNLDISVAYKEDVDRVMSVMRQTWQAMAEDPRWGAYCKSKDPIVLRVNEFGSSGIIIKIAGDTIPMMKWEIMGEYRRRIKQVFDDMGIEIPWPHMKLYLGDEPVKKRLSRES